jgi:hypothetical protein
MDALLGSGVSKENWRTRRCHHEQAGDGNLSHLVRQMRMFATWGLQEAERITTGLEGK